MTHTITLTDNSQTPPVTFELTGTLRKKADTVIFSGLQPIQIPSGETFVLHGGYEFCHISDIFSSFVDDETGAGFMIGELWASSDTTGSSLFSFAFASLRPDGYLVIHGETGDGLQLVNGGTLIFRFIY